MKKLTLLFLFLYTPCSFAATLHVGPIQGTVYNVSVLPTEILKLNLVYNCYYLTDLGMKWTSCGSKTLNSNLNAITEDESRVEFNSFSLKANKPYFSEARFTVDIQVTATDKKGSQYTNSLEIYRIENPENATAEIADAIKELTFIYLAGHKVEFLLSDGSSAISSIRALMGPKDNLRYIIESDVYSPERPVGDAYPISIGSQSFGTPIESLELGPLYLLKTGNLSRFTTDLAELGLVMRLEPENWRERNWGRSWKILAKWKTSFSLKDSAYPDSAARIVVSNWDWH